MPAGRDLLHGGVRRQQRAVTRRRPDGTAGRHDLRVRAGYPEPVGVRRDPSGRYVPVVMPGHPEHHVALLAQLLLHLVLQVGAEHQEGHRGHRQRDRGDRARRGQGEPGAQHQRAARAQPGPPRGHGAVLIT